MRHRVLVVDGEDESLAKTGALLQPLGCDVVGSRPRMTLRPN